jgi:hypothetical protein
MYIINLLVSVKMPRQRVRVRRRAASIDLTERDPATLTTVVLLAESLIVELEAVVGENRFAKPSGEKVLPLLAVSCTRQDIASAPATQAIGIDNSSFGTASYFFKKYIAFGF